MLRKSQASAFFDTLLEIDLRAHRITQLLVCGAPTSGYARATVVDALSLGYRGAVVADACFDRSEMIAHREPV